MVKRELFIDPVTRIEGHLGVRAIVDDETGCTDDDSVRTFVTMFRGFEVFLRGRPPEDAVHITSRICGVCGASHANASVIAADMAYGVSPTPLGVALRNMAFAVTDHLYDHPLILNVLEGPDFSEVVVSKMTPSVWEEAKRFDDLEYVDVHGYRTAADIMRDLNPVTGRLWKLTIKYARIAHEAGVLIYGRHPHPSTLVPGGIGTDLTNAEYLFTAYFARLVSLTAWAKLVATVWHDLFRFFAYAVGLPDGRSYDFDRPSWGKLPKDSYAYNGLTYYKPILVSSGLFDEPEGAYATECGNFKSPEEFYACMDKAAKERLIPPALVYRGELVSDLYSDINVGEIEHPERTFLRDWKGVYRLFVERDPKGTEIHYGKFPVEYHPWNMVTVPAPGKLDWNGKYTWVTHIRRVWPKVYEISPYEVGPYARMYALAYIGKKVDVPTLGTMLEAGGGKIKVWLPRSASTDAVNDLPEGTWREVELTFEIPPFSSTMVRDYARAVNVVVDVVAAWYNLVKAMDLYKKALRAGEIQTSRDWRGRIGGRSLGAGFTEAPRGMVAHWLVQEDGRILNYQIHAPTTPNASPRGDKICTPGYDASKPGREGECVSPYEMSVIKTVITEETKPDQWTGLDIVRAVRSFDPCLACAAHIQVGTGSGARLVKRLVAPYTG